MTLVLVAAVRTRAGRRTMIYAAVILGVSVLAGLH